MNGEQSAKRRLARINPKGSNMEKKQLYWQHEAQKIKKLLDARKSSTNVKEEMQLINEVEAAVWEIIRRRGPQALQRAKHAEVRYTNVMARLDAQRQERLKKEREVKMRGKEQSTHQPVLRTEGAKPVLEAKATYCGRCGTTHVAPKFGGTCPALKKESMDYVSEISNELLQRYKQKAGAQVDNPSTPSKIKYKRGLGHLMATVKQMKSGKPMPPVKEQMDPREYDYEGDMAKTQLKTIIRNAQRMYAMLRDPDNMPEWVQSKITLAKDYIVTAANYLESEMSEEAKKIDASPIHPNALHVKPVKVGNEQKYKVHAVGKNFAHGIKVGEHLTDTELDDFADMGGKIKHIKEDEMKSFKQVVEEMRRGRGRPRKNPEAATKHDSEDEHEYGPSARPASREGSSSHIVQQLASAAHDDLPKKGRDVDFKHHTGFVPQHVAKKAIEHYTSLKRSEDKANWAADHYEMHHKDFVKKFS